MKNIENEIWKKVEGFNRYWVSNVGRVKNQHGLIKNQVHSAGYHVNSLNRKKHYTHRLVAQAFIPNPDNKPFINHKNGVKTDNRVDNLEWVSPMENMEHAHETGLMDIMKGSTHPRSRLTEKDIPIIRDLLQEGKTCKEIGEMFNVARRTIVDIRVGNTWTHVKTDHVFKVKDKSPLTEEDVREIKKALKEGVSRRELSKRYNVVYETIRGIDIGKRWGHIN